MNQGFSGQVLIPHLVVFKQLPENLVTDSITLSALSTNSAVGVVVTFTPSLSIGVSGAFINLYP